MIRIAVFILAALYPVLVFCFLIILKMPLRYFSVFVVFTALAVFLGATSKKKITAEPSLSGQKHRSGRSGFPVRIVSAVLLGATGLACLLSNRAVFIKLYPVLMNAVMLCAFGFSLASPPSMIFRFATLADKSIRGSLAEKRIEKYCKNVTVIWCAFFILNGGIAAWTVFSGSDVIWSFYNGGISYILIGILFAGEFMIRKITDKKMPKAVALSAFKTNSRPADHVLCYEKSWSDGVYKTWRNFFEDTARLRSVITQEGSESWILHAEDNWYFLCAFTALLQCRREIRLTANITPAYIREIRERSDIKFLTDQLLSEEEAAGKTLYIPSLLQAPPAAETSSAPETASAAGTANQTIPVIKADETRILLYTSGTTGKPKIVTQRLTELENDNKFIISKYGEEWLRRKVCGTVSQHHIYGLLYMILLPFTAGVPFRRKRIENPKEFETLGLEPMMIISVPAFLKRAVELKASEGETANFGLIDPWIYTSGGVLDVETAEKTSRIFGFWPLEVYGSTETSGIAWRQSKNGLEWMPFDNAKISQDAEGHLVIRSPYIRDTEGFVTADLADILPDGRFLLKGRSDSIVKIEEKRVSLTEVEMRLMESGFVRDVCVIAIKESRQYLAAAVVLNENGEREFGGLEKFRINRRFREYLTQFLEPAALPKKWRYLQTLPLDSQGKKAKSAIEALFDKSEKGASLSSDVLSTRRLSNEKVLEQSAEKAVLEFSIPEDSDYFNEHFPELKVLPAIAQIELAVRFANRFLKSSLYVKKSKRMKFSSLVRPDTPLRLELSMAAMSGVKASAASGTETPQLVTFTYSSPDGSIVYSTGTFITEKVI